MRAVLLCFMVIFSINKFLAPIFFLTLVLFHEGFCLGLILQYIPFSNYHSPLNNGSRFASEEPYNAGTSALSNSILLYVLLPPIIFNAGFSVNRVYS